LSLTEFDTVYFYVTTRARNVRLLPACMHDGATSLINCICQKYSGQCCAIAYLQHNLRCFTLSISWIRDR